MPKPSNFPIMRHYLYTLFLLECYTYSWSCLRIRFTTRERKHHLHPESPLALVKRIASYSTLAMGTLAIQWRK